MKFRLALDKGPCGYPKHSLFLGSLNGDDISFGIIGIGTSYYDDGTADIGLIIGNRYLCLEILWGAALVAHKAWKYSA